MGFTCVTLKASAPGNLMLMGEHAVLKGERALACAVDKRIHLTLTTRPDRNVTIQSALGHYSASLDLLTPAPEFSFVLAAIERHQPQLIDGFDLAIESEFSHTVGLGSSAAVTAAVVAALMMLVSSAEAEEPTQDQIFDQALAVVHRVQGGRGSGTDLAATIFGGIIGYTQTPRQVVAYPCAPDIRLFYVGYKMKTPDVIAYVEGLAVTNPSFYQALYGLMGEATSSAEQAVSQQNWPQLGHWMNVYNGLLDALGVNDANLADMVAKLRQQSGNLGAKISGSGLGDCVVALVEGKRQTVLSDYVEIPVAVSKQGVVCEFI